jgi:hypothetical protein
LYPEYVGYDDIPEKTIPRGIKYADMVALVFREIKKAKEHVAKNLELLAELESKQ